MSSVIKIIWGSFAFWSLGMIMTYSTSTFGQGEKVMISLDGNIRYRFEQWENMNAKSYGENPAIGHPDDYILLQRIIAGTTITYKDRITLSCHVQDSRAFGWSLRNALEPDAFKVHAVNQTEPYYTMNPQEEYFELYDLNLKIDSLFHLVSVVAGRQKIYFTDYRIFGPGDWGNTGRWTWDAVKVSVDKEKWSLATWYGGTKINDPTKTYLPFTHTEYTGGGLHSTLRFLSRVPVDLYMAHKHQGSASYIRDQQINRNWAGFRAYNPDTSRWQYEASYTFEFGEENQSVIRASGLFLKFGYHFQELVLSPRLTIRYTYASGNHPEKEHTGKYDPAFGAGDKYYGWMNLLSWSNLDDREVMLELFPMKGMHLELKYNMFYIPEPEGVKINGNLELPEGKKHLGDEFDLMAKYRFSSSWQFTGAFGLFRPVDAITDQQVHPGNAYWLAVQILYNFDIGLIKI